MSSSWVRLLGVPGEPELFPTDWELIRDTIDGHVAVIGRSKSDSIEVVVRIELAMTRIEEGPALDIREQVGTEIRNALAYFVNRPIDLAAHRERQQNKVNQPDQRARRGRHKAPRKGSDLDD